jgi:hypothetical protein
MAFLIAKTSTMAKDKKSFIIYCDVIHTVEKLSDEQAGALFKHLLRYVNDQKPSADQFIEVVFEPIKQQLKRDLLKFEDTKQKRSEAGKVGANKRWHDIANDSKRIQSIAKIAVNDNVNDNDIKEEYTIDFEALLQYVNNAFGRNFRVVNNDVKAKYKRLFKNGYEKSDILKAINNCKEDKWHKENNYQYCTLEYFSRPATIDKYSDTTETNTKGIMSHPVIID